jgi:DMSO/TMAO reductase YedYZ heme-binding membrane subunit
MRHIPRKWWHRIHLSSLVLLVLATVHGFTAGTDRSNALARWTALAISAALIFVMTFRVLADRKAQRAARVRPSPAPKAADAVAPEPTAEAAAPAPVGADQGQD